jgi:hypothetical protein
MPNKSVRPAHDTRRSEIEKTHPHESDKGQTKGRPEDKPEVSVLFLVKFDIKLCIRDARGSRAVDILDEDSKTSVGEHPEGDETCAECPVRILYPKRSVNIRVKNDNDTYIHGRRLYHLLFLDFLDGTGDRFLECGIKVLLMPLHIFDRGGDVVFTLLGGQRWQGLLLIASLRSPGNVMPMRIPISKRSE